jgi:hypothetical protein
MVGVCSCMVEAVVWHKLGFRSDNALAAGTLKGDEGA